MLTNILKHARATEVEIEILINKNHIRLIVNDNDIGFDKKAVTNGIGLKTIQNNIEFLKGKLDLRRDKGTIVKIQTPFSLK
ncbi:MAG: sensor histidine kinase [Mucilaginibacter sp.]